MSKYIKYNECLVEINGKKILGLSADLSANASLAPKKPIEVESIEYRANAALSASLNVSYYVTGLEDHISSLTGDHSCSGSFGGIKFSGAYLNKYSVDVEPYVPVVFSANFSIFSGYDESSITPDSFSGNALEFANGAYTDINNIDSINVGIDYPVSINYSVDCERIPSYEIGNEFACDVRYGMVTKNLSIDGENIGSFIDFSGKNIAKVSLTPKSMNNSRRGEVIECEGVVYSQNLSVSKGDVLDGSISITERVR